MGANTRSENTDENMIDDQLEEEKVAHEVSPDEKAHIKSMEALQD